MGNWLWYLLGVVTIPACVTLIAAAQWAFSKTSGTGNCLVEWCNHQPLELGEHFNITVWANTMRHRLTVSRKHKRAVLAFWQDRKDRGFGVNPYVAKRLK